MSTSAPGGTTPRYLVWIFRNDAKSTIGLYMLHPSLAQGKTIYIQFETTAAGCIRRLRKIATWRAG